MVLVLGGSDLNGNLLTSAEVYDSSTDSWTPAASMMTAREGHTATTLGNDRVLMAGGDFMAAGTASAEIYLP
jgi:hypothetical protein